MQRPRGRRKPDGDGGPQKVSAAGMRRRENGGAGGGRVERLGRWAPCRTYRRVN